METDRQTQTGGDRQAESNRRRQTGGDRQRNGPAKTDQQRQTTLPFCYFRITFIIAQQSSLRLHISMTLHPT